MIEPISRRQATKFIGTTETTTVGTAIAPTIGAGKVTGTNTQWHEIVDPATGLTIAASSTSPANRKQAVPILYVHGATFASELSVGYRFDNRSWRDVLLDQEHSVWTIDFLGFGRSSRYPAMAGPASGAAPLGRADMAAGQIDAVVDYIIKTTGQLQISIIAHSWGTIAAGRFASLQSGKVARMVFFAPIVDRTDTPPPLTPSAGVPAWMDVSLKAQWDRFVEDVPEGEAQVLPKPSFDEWSQAYLASDIGAPSRTPPSVRVPFGPVADIGAAWSGHLAYDPKKIASPVRIIRGEWDSLSTVEDAAHLLAGLPPTLEASHVELARGTHLMHLEDGRGQVYAAASDWLVQ